MTAPSDPMERLLIEWECARLVNTYNLLNDAGRFEEAADLFAEDGSYLTPATPEPVVGRQAILQMLRQRPMPTARHFVTNLVIDVVSPTEARGHSYLLVLLSNDPDPAKAVASMPALTGEVEEHFLLTPDGWRLGHRRGKASIRFAG